MKMKTYVRVKSKKGWIRILEAFLAVALISSVLVFLYVRTITPRGEDVYNLQKTILDEIAASPILRNATLNSDNNTIMNFVKERIPSGFEFTIRICEPEDICSLPEYKEEVYATERIISSTLLEYSPKKVKIFMWKG